MGDFRQLVREGWDPPPCLKLVGIGEDHRTLLSLWDNQQADMSKYQDVFTEEFIKWWHRNQEGIYTSRAFRASNIWASGPLGAISRIRAFHKLYTGKEKLGKVVKRIGNFLILSDGQVYTSERKRYGETEILSRVDLMAITGWSSSDPSEGWLSKLAAYFFARGGRYPGISLHPNGNTTITRSELFQISSFLCNIPIKRMEKLLELSDFGNAKKIEFGFLSMNPIRQQYRNFLLTGKGIPQEVWTRPFRSWVESLPKSIVSGKSFEDWDDLVDIYKKMQFNSEEPGDGEALQEAEGEQIPSDILVRWNIILGISADTLNRLDKEGELARYRSVFTSEFFEWFKKKATMVRISPVWKEYPTAVRFPQDKVHVLMVVGTLWQLYTGRKPLGTVAKRFGQFVVSKDGDIFTNFGNSSTKQVFMGSRASSHLNTWVINLLSGSSDDYVVNLAKAYSFAHRIPFSEFENIMDLVSVLKKTGIKIEFIRNDLTDHLRGKNKIPEVAFSKYFHQWLSQLPRLTRRFISLEYAVAHYQAMLTNSMSMTMEVIYG